MHQFRFQSNNVVLLLLALAALAACSPSRQLIGGNEIVATHRDAQAWDDFMPGSAPKCHAFMAVTLRNTTEEDIVLLSAEGTLLDARSDTPLRRFAASIVYNDIETPEVRLAPGSGVDLTFRTPMGVPPLDRRKYAHVRIRIRAHTSLGLPLILQSRPVELLVTQ